MEITSYLLGKKAGGGGEPPVYQDKEVEITQNGETRITADNGYDALSSVEVTTNVPQPSGKIQITQNGTDIDVSSYATADVSVSGQKYAPRIIKFGSPTNGGNYTGNDLNYEVSNIDTSNLIEMADMFRGALNITSLDLSAWNTANVTNLSNAFNGCQSLTSLDLSNWDTSKVTNMGYMFYNCSSLTSLDLSSFSTPLLTNTGSMFFSCTNLTKIDMRNFDFSSVTTLYTGMFGSDYTTASQVPSNCLIIVKDATQKQWITSKFSRMTNVKTVAEYEG